MTIAFIIESPASRPNCPRTAHRNRGPNAEQIPNPYRAPIDIPRYPTKSRSIDHASAAESTAANQSWLIR